MSSAQFAAYLKKQIPELAQFPDDELVKGVLARRPDLASRIGEPEHDPDARFAVTGTGTIGLHHEPEGVLARVRNEGQEARTQLMEFAKRGAGEGPAEFMESIPLGMSKAVTGTANMLQGNIWSGLKEQMGGALEASQIPGAFIAPGAARAVTGRSLAERLLSATPERIGELGEVKGTFEQIYNLFVDTERRVHQVAKALFPDVKTPVRLSETVPKFTARSADILEPASQIQGPETTATREISFRQAQEMRSKLLADITDEKVAVQRGATPRFDLADMLKRLRTLDDAMSTAAQTDGKLPQLQRARAFYGKYMQDFHDTGSPIRDLLKAKPDETNKIAGHLLSPDKGARALEVLRGYRENTEMMEKVLGRGRTPLQIDVNEAAKLRKAGSGENYFRQRIQEGLDQAKFNRLPSKAEARLPAWVMRSKLLGLPNTPITPSPRFLTSQFLQMLSEQFPVGGVK